MRYAKINPYDVTNGDGVRVSLFVTGCEHYCEECFNKEIWDFNEGTLYTTQTEEIIVEYVGKQIISGLSVLGGEPLHPKNIEGILKLIKKIKQKYPEKDIWVWTGYLYEDLQEIYGVVFIEFLNSIEYLIDGKYIPALKDIKLKYKGSYNQRVIDVKKTLKKGKIVLKEEDNERF